MHKRFLSARKRHLTFKFAVLFMAVVDTFLAGFLVYCLLSTSPSAPPAQPMPSPSEDPPAVLGEPVPTDRPSTPLRSTPTPTLTVLTATLAPVPTATHLSFEEPTIYGTSYGKRALTFYRLGTGSSARAIVGGIHGGYEWNTVELVSQTLTYFRQHPDLIPPEVSLYIIPCANPDGFAAGTDLVSGRMNGNGVDLNRNWDYQWQMTATHGTRPVSAGAYPFSEPETAALRDFLLGRHVQVAVFYHSAMARVFSGADRAHSASFDLAKVMSDATGYLHAPEGVPGQITTGDAIDWLSTQGIAAVEIDLTTHQDIEWQRNLYGILAFLKWSIPGRGPIVTPLSKTPPGYIVHIVQPEDTLWTLSRRYGVSIQEIKLANQLTDENLIVAGQSLLIPTGEGGDND